MRTVTVAGGNLFRIAAEQLGDATQWVRIAELNALGDPMLQGLVTLKLPDDRPAAREAALAANSVLRTPRLEVLANGVPLPAVYAAEIVSNNHLAADRFCVHAATIARNARRLRRRSRHPARHPRRPRRLACHQPRARQCRSASRSTPFPALSASTAATSPPASSRRARRRRSPTRHQRDRHRARRPPRPRHGRAIHHDTGRTLLAARTRQHHARSVQPRPHRMGSARHPRRA